MTSNPKTHADPGWHYCFVRTVHGWRNQGMVPDDNRGPFIAEYMERKGDAVAFVPFCWTNRPNVMTDSQIHSYAPCIF